MRIRLHTKDNRFGITRGEKYVKLQIGWLRIYISRLPLKPKHASATRKSTRKAVLRRDGGRCRHCGRELTISTLSLHHVKPRAQFPELANDPDNCIALCRHCHIKLHMERQPAPVISVNPVEKTTYVLNYGNS